MAEDYGIKISVPNIQVELASDIESLFSSKFSTLKILSWGNLSLTTDGSGNGTASVNHNLGYTPAHFIFRKGTASFSFLDTNTYANAFTPVTQDQSIWMGNSVFNVYSTTTQLVVSASAQTANTTYTFRYYLLVDLAESYSGASGISLQNDSGMKVSKPGQDVKSAPEYQMVYSNKYKSLQYYDVGYKTQLLSLPEVDCTLNDTPQTAGTYLDIMHGLGYPPFFLAWADGPLLGSGVGQTGNFLIPFYQDYGNYAAGKTGYRSLDGFSDANRVRISLVEQVGCNMLSGGGNGNNSLAAISATIRCVVFTEDLTA